MAIKRLGVTVFEKVCRGPCGRLLPLSSFHRHGAKWEGRCGPCRNSAIKANRDARRHGLMERNFWAKVDKSSGPDACWPWTGAVNGDGYGMVRRRGWPGSAHRAASWLTAGDLPNDVCVLHRCDNPPCCNPAHLFRGTNVANTADRNQKGRQAKGERNANSKLTEADVLAILDEHGMGMSVASIAARHDVVPGTIYFILSGSNWRHVPRKSPERSGAAR